MATGLTAYKGNRDAKRAAPQKLLGVPLTHADKPLWPDANDGMPVTKLDLARYYEGIGAWMLPHLAGRPCSLVRAPDGIGGQRFFQRHSMAGTSKLIGFVKLKGERQPYLKIDRIEALIAAAQMAALELHPWNSQPGDPECAARLVFDLDPAKDVPFESVVSCAVELQERLGALKLAAFLKTTGGKGLHVVSPLAGPTPWHLAKDFAHELCARMAADSPERYIDNMSKAKRTGRIFLDYLRNDRTATAVAPLSPRARPHATVSMPLDWKAARKGFDPTTFTVRSAADFLRRSQPWRDYAVSGMPLQRAAKLMAGKR